MGLAKLYGENEANIINRENFYGIYLLPFGIELHRIGYQEISELEVQFEQNDTIESKIKKIYEEFKKIDKELNIEDKLNIWRSRVDSITNENGKIIINLTKEEKKKRISDLLKAMGELGRQIEGSERNLSPYFAVFSLDYATPKYLLFLKEKLRKKESFTESDIKNYASADGKNVIVATHEDYNAKINSLIKEIETIW
jgi:CRISPR-associated protein Cst2